MDGGSKTLIAMKTRIVMATLILALVPASGWGVALLVNGGFENQTGGLPNSWTYSQGDGPSTLQSSTVSPFVNIHPTGLSSILVTDGASTTVTPNVIQSFTTQTSGILYAAWDFRLNSMTGSYWGVQIDDAITAQTFFRMDDGGNFVVENPSGATTTVMALTTGTWYQVQLALDLSNKTLSGSITSESGTTTPIPNQSWRVTAGSSSINRVVILDNPVSGAAAGGILFDNFQVDRTAFAPASIVPEPSRTVFLGMAGLVICIWRRRKLSPGGQSVDRSRP